MINISTYSSKDNPHWPRPEEPSPRPPAARLGDRAGDRSLGAQVRSALAGLGAIGSERLASVARRRGDRLFMRNDDEAGWRGWQAVRVYGGLGRRYRDARFDTLAECARCRGAGLNGGAPCIPCLGTGRITIGKVG